MLITLRRLIEQCVVVKTVTNVAEISSLFLTLGDFKLFGGNFQMTIKKGDFDVRNSI